MIHRKLIILVLTAIAVLLVITPLYAQTTPNQIGLVDKYKATNVIKTGDALYIAVYYIVYNNWPAEPVDSATPAVYAPISTMYNGSLIEYDNTGTQVGAPSLSPELYSDQNPEDGYGYGVWSLYFEVDPFTAADAAGGTVKLCNEPNATTGPSGTRHCEDHASIDYLGEGANEGKGFVLPDDIKLFQEAMLGIAEKLEVTWGTIDDEIELIKISTSQRVLTTEGEDYMGHAIPQIRNILPELFVSGTSTPEFTPDETIDRTYETGRQSFFAGTELDITDGSGSALDLLGNVVGLDDNPQLVGTALVVLVACGIAFFCIQVTQQATMGLFAAILVLQVGAFVGLVSFAITAVLALIGALALGYIFFYKSSTS